MYRRSALHDADLMSGLGQRDGYREASEPTAYDYDMLYRNFSV